MTYKSNKIQDRNARAGGRASIDNIDNFKNLYVDKFKPLRTPKLNVQKIFSPYSVERLPDFIMNTYKFNALEFGNWVNQVRRLDFCLNMVAGLYDLQNVLKFKNNNLGFNLIEISFGARGMAKAYAHYEPAQKVINLTRDRRVDKFVNDQSIHVDDANTYKAISEYLRKDLSGYGSFAHEYGHALDYILAEKYTKENRSLSGGAENLFSFKKPVEAYKHFNSVCKNGNDLQDNFKNCFEAFLFTKGKPTSFYKRVYMYAEKKSDYWSRFNEIWARIFETYIAYKLYQKGVKDFVLNRGGKGKYRDEDKNYLNYYPSFGELGKHVKKVDRFVETINKYIK